MMTMFIFNIADLLFLLGGILVVLLWVWVSGCKAYRESRCKHNKGANETLSRDAICKSCGKNLGFIGDWRK